MAAKIRYLVCYAGTYMIAIPSAAIRRIWKQSHTPDAAEGVTLLDLRNLLGVESTGEGVLVALNDSESVLMVDEIRGMTMITESEFLPLPSVFAFIKAFFDAACREPIDGRHPLRLRLQPLPSDGCEDVAPL